MHPIRRPSARRFFAIISCLVLCGANFECPPDFVYTRSFEASRSPTGAILPADLVSTVEVGDIDEDGPFPVPLEAKAPLGSLVYDPVFVGRLVVLADQDGFESGALGPQWATSSSTANGRIQVDGGFGTAAGAFALLMDVTVSGPSNLNEAIWTVDLSGQTAVLLRFSHANFSDEANPLPANFVGSANGDGVAISDDGVNWHTILNATLGAFGVWNEVTIDVAAEAAGAGMSLGSGFQIKFQQFDNFPLTTDGRGYDEIALEIGGEDTDSFAIEIDPGQTISIVLETDPGLQASVQIAQAGSVIAGASADAPGETVVLQTIPTVGRLAGEGPGPRLYELTLDSLGGTGGGYTLQIILNAAVEDESLGGSTNGDLDSAQDIGDSFVHLLRAVDASGTGPAPDRGAVLGTTDAISTERLDADGFESGALGAQWTVFSSTPSGRIQVDGSFGTAAGAFALLMDVAVVGQNNLNEAIWTVDLSGQTEALLTFFHANFADEANLLPNDFVGSADGDGVAISDDGVNWHTVLNATPGGFGVWDEVTIDLAGEAATAGMSLGVNFQIKFQQFDNFPLTTDGRGYDEIAVELPLPSDDLYSFELEAGESVTLALTGRSAGTVELELLDAEGSVLADATSSANPIVNGSFESGDFTGWTVATTGSPFRPWQVSGAGLGGGFGMASTAPQDGTFVAWNGFDGSGPMSFTMFQDVTIPADGSATSLRWSDRIQWSFLLGGFASLPREYFVEVRDPDSNAVLQTLVSFSTGTQATNPTGDTGWQMHAADLSAFVGMSVRLSFREEIPQSFTGPAQLEIDDVGLGMEGPTNVDRLIQGFVADRTGTYFARVGGDADTDYTLLVLRNAALELEDNDDFATAHQVVEPQVAGRSWILGHVSGATFYGGSRLGELFTIDLASGAGTFVGALPSSGSTEIEHSNTTGRSFTQFPDGAFAGQEFDIDTGAGIAAPIFNGFSFNGLEYVGATLYGTAISGPRAPSTLRTLDPVTGGSVAVGPTGVGPISGLAYDAKSGVMYGIAGGPGPASLYTIDLSSGAATPVGLTNFQAGSLEFGPDGVLYGGGTGPDGGDLFRIDPATGASTLVGPTGFATVTGLTLRTGAGATDFYAIELDDGDPLHVRTYTPAGKSGEFLNEFDPMLRLYDSSGALVDSDDDSAPDKRNARIEFHVAKGEGGTYFIEVRASDNNREPRGGEYLLSIK